MTPPITGHGGPAAGVTNESQPSHAAGTMPPMHRDEIDAALDLDRGTVDGTADAGVEVNDRNAAALPDLRGRRERVRR
jgi:hypothetical protein